MKTIHKRSGTTKHEASKHLIDHPIANAFLNSPKVRITEKQLLDFIRLKEYKSRLMKAETTLFLSLGLCVSLLTAIAAFEWKTNSQAELIQLSSNSSGDDELLNIPVTQQIQKPPAIIISPEIVEVADEKIIESIEVNLDIEMSEDTRIESVIYASPHIESLPEEKADEIFTIVEEQPSPNGGMREFYDYVGKNLSYPPKASRMGIQGRVFVEFIVEKNGTLTDIKVAKGIGGGCDEEAIRVISEAPRWNPGKQRGQPVRVRMVMPIVFKLLT